MIGQPVLVLYYEEKTNKTKQENHYISDRRISLRNGRQLILFSIITFTDSSQRLLILPILLGCIDRSCVIVCAFGHHLHWECPLRSDIHEFKLDCVRMLAVQSYCSPKYGELN